MITVARITSSLLLVALCILWIRGYWVKDRLTWTRHDPSGHWVTNHIVFVDHIPPVYVAIENFSLTCGDGRVRLARAGWNVFDTWSKYPDISSPPLEPQAQMHPLDVSRHPGFTLSHPTAFLTPTADRFGFRDDAGHSRIYYSGWRAPDWDFYVHEWGIPIWLPIALTAIVPLLWLRRLWLDRYKRRKGACPACGYDLRASPNRCPECGAVAATSL